MKEDNQKRTKNRTVKKIIIMAVIWIPDQVHEYTQSSLCPNGPAHKAIIIANCHCFLSLAFFVSSPQLTLSVHCSLPGLSWSCSCFFSLMCGNSGCQMAPLVQSNATFSSSPQRCNSSFKMIFGQTILRIVLRSFLFHS